jgi:hypothetical protein
MRENAGVADKMRAWFGMESAPHGDTLNYAYQRLEVEEVVSSQYFGDKNTPSRRFPRKTG